MLRFARLPILAAVTAVAGFHSISTARAQSAVEVAERLEADLGGHIGVLLRPLGGGDALESHRADERFPMSSTFKSLLCGAVLARVDAGEESLGRIVPIEAADLVTYSPVTETHVGEGMSVGDLCEATITLSDNAAGNLLLETIGGPEGLTAFLRSLGDDVTRLDRYETELNEGVPGDPRDTTTPEAMLASLETLLFGDRLEAASRDVLRRWMIDDQVADALIRAPLPEGWTIGDKTGAGGHGSRGIVAFLAPPGGPTYLAAIYMTGSEAQMEARNAALSEIGSAMIRTIEAR